MLQEIKSVALLSKCPSYVYIYIYFFFFNILSHTFWIKLAKKDQPKKNFKMSLEGQ